MPGFPGTDGNPVSIIKMKEINSILFLKQPPYINPTLRLDMGYVPLV